MTKTINKEGLDLIKASEGLRLKAYPDPATGKEPWTIGYGHTGEDVWKDKLISNLEAERLLKDDLIRFEAGVNKSVTWGSLTDNQFSALVCFAFNVGLANLYASTLLKKLNAGDIAGSAAEFVRWNKAAGKVMDGLTKRRTKEAELFLKK